MRRVLRDPRSAAAWPAAWPARAASVSCAAVLIGLAACAPRDPVAEAERALAEGRLQEAYRLAREATDAMEGTGEAEPATRGPAADAARAWITRARAAYVTMRTSPGVEAAARAVELAPEDPAAYAIQARLDQRRRRNVAAVESARRAVELAPEDPQNHIRLGELLLGGGMVGTADLPGAEAAFRAALERDPDALRACRGLGETLVTAGRHEEGAAELDRYLEEFPFDGMAHYHRGLARLRARDFKRAEADFERATVLPPHPHPAFFNRARALQMLGRDDEAEEMRLRYQVLRPLQMDAETLETNYHSHSDNLMIALDVAARLTEAGRLDAAKGILESASRDNPDLPRPHLMLADVALLDQDVERARPAAEAAIAATAGSAVAHQFAARAAAMDGDAAAAVEHARPAADAEPGNAELRLILGNQLLQTGQNEEAARVFGEGRRLAPNDARFVAGVGRALAAAGRAAEAEPLLTSALGVRARSGDWLTSRGRAREALGKDAAAEDDYRTSVSVAPGHLPAYDALAALLRRTGRGDEARETEAAGRAAAEQDRELDEARRAFHRHPADAAAAGRYAAALRQAGRSAEADIIEGRSAAAREEFIW